MNFCFFKGSRKSLNGSTRELIRTHNQMEDYATRAMFFLSVLEVGALEDKYKMSLINYLNSYAKAYIKLYGDDECLRKNFIGEVRQTFVMKNSLNNINRRNMQCN